ncbi:MAG: hypothetical protein QXD03_02685 [Candidatus Anstonellales archaeon]
MRKDFIISGILSLVVVVILMLNISMEEFSVSKLMNTYRSIENSNRLLTNISKEMERNKFYRDRLEDRRREIENKIRCIDLKNFNMNLDIPATLILMEQRAKINKLDIFISDGEDSKEEVGDSVNIKEGNEIINNERNDNVNIQDTDNNGDKSKLGNGDKSKLGNGDKSKLGNGDKSKLGNGDKSKLGNGDKSKLGNGDNKVASKDVNNIKENNKVTDMNGNNKVTEKGIEGNKLNENKNEVAKVNEGTGYKVGDINSYKLNIKNNKDRLGEYKVKVTLIGEYIDIVKFIEFIDSTDCIKANRIVFKAVQDKTIADVYMDILYYNGIGR